MAALRSLGLAVSFLTCLPAGGARSEPGDFGRSLAFFPVVGAGIGAALGGVAWWIGPRLSPELVAVLLVALAAALSGALHLDGLADTFDALGGARGDRARMLAILRDSRIGAHGAVALVLLLLGKVLALAAVVQSGAWLPVVAYPAVGRWAVTSLVSFFPYARQAGLGRSFHDEARAIHWLLATAVLLTATVGAGALGELWLPVLAAGVTALALGGWLARRLGGLTGDTHGAAIELSELCFLLVAAGSGGAP